MYNQISKSFIDDENRYVGEVNSFLVLNWKQLVITIRNTTPSYKVLTSKMTTVHRLDVFLMEGGVMWYYNSRVLSFTFGVLSIHCKPLRFALTKFDAFTKRHLSWCNSGGSKFEEKLRIKIPPQRVVGAARIESFFNRMVRILIFLRQVRDCWPRHIRGIESYDVGYENSLPAFVSECIIFRFY